MDNAFITSLFPLLKYLTMAAPTGSIFRLFQDKNIDSQVLPSQQTLRATPGRASRTHFPTEVSLLIPFEMNISDSVTYLKPHLKNCLSRNDPAVV